MKPAELALRSAREIDAARKAGHITKTQAKELMTTCLKSIFLTPPPKEDKP